MRRLYRLIFTGKVSLYLSAYGAIGAVIFFPTNFFLSKYLSDSKLFEIAFELFYFSLPVAFCISLGSALAVLFDPPWFQRPKIVLIRIAIALIITFVTAATAAILLAYMLKRIKETD